MENTLIKRESIIFTTIDLINESGFQGVSTREVAKRQGISQGSVFQYFPKKNDLLAAVLDHFSLYDNDLFYSTKIRNRNPREAILYYIDAYAAYQENYPAIAALNQAYGVLYNDPDLGGRVKEIFANRADFLKQLLEEAQAEGFINREADSEALADIIASVQRGLCLKWRMEDHRFSLRERTLQFVGMLLDAFS
jgi:AcrR family transcriptional regulator